MERKYAEQLACEFAQTILENGGINHILGQSDTYADSVADFIQTLTNRFENELVSPAISVKK